MNLQWLLSFRTRPASISWLTQGLLMDVGVSNTMKCGHCQLVESLDRVAYSPHAYSNLTRPLQESPLPSRDHQSWRLALFSVRSQLPRCGRAPLRSRHHRDL